MFFLYILLVCNREMFSIVRLEEMIVDGRQELSPFLGHFLMHD